MNVVTLPTGIVCSQSPAVDSRHTYTARVARVNGAALANLAWAPTAPKNAKID